MHPKTDTKTGVGKPDTNNSADNAKRKKNQ
jgi:hypothetical protein